MGAFPIVSKSASLEGLAAAITRLCREEKPRVRQAVRICYQLACSCHTNSPSSDLFKPSDRDVRWLQPGFRCVPMLAAATPAASHCHDLVIVPTCAGDKGGEDPSGESPLKHALVAIEVSRVKPEGDDPHVE